jgi:hypothetical protein
VCYDGHVIGQRAPVSLALAVLLTATVEAAEPPALAKARALYNAADYDGAISSAAAARRLPAVADAAALVTARALLERYNRAANSEDLAAARDALASVRAAALSPRDQVDLLVGLGQSLFFDALYGAAAELFDTALGRASLLPHPDRMRLLDWWASSLDSEVRARAVDRREPVFERIAERMEAELGQDPGNAPANYWLAVAARSTGDAERAWNLAVAAWIRAGLAPATSEALRADLDRLVTEAIIPERARTMRDVSDASAVLRTEWDLVKERWK